MNATTLAMLGVLLIVRDPLAPAAATSTSARTACAQQRQPADILDEVCIDGVAVVPVGKKRVARRRSTRMGIEIRPQPSGSATVGLAVIEWRREQLLLAGFRDEPAEELARDWRYDLHALIELVERGCEPSLAARILAPLDDLRAQPHGVG